MLDEDIEGDRMMDQEDINKYFKDPSSSDDEDFNFWDICIMQNIQTSFLIFKSFLQLFYLFFINYLSDFLCKLLVYWFRKFKKIYYHIIKMLSMFLFFYDLVFLVFFGFNIAFFVILCWFFCFFILFIFFAFLLLALLVLKLVFLTINFWFFVTCP